MSAGAEPPAPWRDAPVVTIDDAVLADPAPTVRRLHEAWARREPVVIALGVDPAGFREPQSFPVEPWRVAPEAEPWFDRLHFLTWANTYDARAGDAGVVVGRQGRPPRRRRRGHARRRRRHHAARRHAGVGRRRPPDAGASPASTVVHS